MLTSRYSDKSKVKKFFIRQMTKRAHNQQAATQLGQHKYRSVQVQLGLARQEAATRGAKRLQSTARGL